jgi:hypothetical protein
MGNTSNTEIYGLRVIKIFEESPAASIGLGIYTDFIIDVLEKPPNFNLENDFYKFIIDHENKQINFKIFNVLTREVRVVPFKPSRDWPNADFLLGFKVRYESASSASENIFRITGLKNRNLFDRIHIQDDFFIAIVEFIYKDLDELKTKLCLYPKVEIVVYNLVKARVRTIEFELEPDQGLGFEIASGYLHDLNYLIQNSQKELKKSSDQKMYYGDTEKKGLFGKKAPEIELVQTKKTSNESQAVSKEVGQIITKVQEMTVNDEQKIDDFYKEDEALNEDELAMVNL